MSSLSQQRHCCNNSSNNNNNKCALRRSPSRAYSAVHTRTINYLRARGERLEAEFGAHNWHDDEWLHAGAIGPPALEGLRARDMT